MNIDYINTLYPDAKNTNPKLYIQSLETLISVLEEKIEMLESSVTNNEKNINEYQKLFDEFHKLFDEAMTLLEKRRIEMYGDDENDGELIKAFQDGFQQAIQQGATYDNPLGDGYITSDGVDKRTGEKINEKTH